MLADLILCGDITKEKSALRCHNRRPLGGEAMFVGNIEYTYPLMDFIKGAAFYDIGNVWPIPMILAAAGLSRRGFGR